jgi:hypothetical protein
LAEKKLPLSTLRVLAIGDGPATVTLARDWANDLIDCGYDEQLVVDLSILDDEDVARLRQVWPLALRKFSLNDLSDRERAIKARRLLTIAFLEERVSALDFARQYRSFLEEHWSGNQQNQSLGFEYGMLWHIDEVLNWVVPQSHRDPYAADALKRMKKEGPEPETDERAWVLQEFRRHGLVDEAGAPLEARW